MIAIILWVDVISLDYSKLSAQNIRHSKDISVPVRVELMPEI